MDGIGRNRIQHQKKKANRQYIFMKKLHFEDNWLQNFSLTEFYLRWQLAQE
jgi:hypothetical protein